MRLIDRLPPDLRDLADKEAIIYSVLCHCEREKLGYLETIEMIATHLARNNKLLRDDMVELLQKGANRTVFIPSDKVVFK